MVVPLRIMAYTSTTVGDKAKLHSQIATSSTCTSKGRDPVSGKVRNVGAHTTVRSRACDRPMATPIVASHVHQ